MNHTMLLAILLALLATGGGIAWIMLADSESPRTVASEAPAPVAPDTTSAEPEARRDEPEALSSRDSTSPQENHSDAESQQEQQAGRDSNERTDSRGDDSTGDGNARKRDERRQSQRSQDRPLTRAEREEQRREKRGRPALRRRLARTPGGAGAARASLRKSAVPEEWEDQWREEGITPPKMIPTPVTGKIMSEQAREGLDGATVGLISFFPVNGVAGGQLLPVITELETNKDGYFEGEIPGGEVVPVNYPQVALAVTWEARRIVTAIPVETLLVGQPNELGIFWAPELPYELKTDASQFDGNLKVVSTGELDPQRWHRSKSPEILDYFPQAQITAQGEEDAGKGTLVSTWDGRDLPYVSLLDSTDILQTRRPTPASLASSVGAPQSFDELVFENDMHSPIGGQVVDDRGAAIPGAVITTLGDAVTRTIVTDTAGWFFIEDPPEQTDTLHCTHDDWVETRVSPVVPGDSNVTITMDTPRPRIPLFITDKLTQEPLLNVGFSVTGLVPWGDNAGSEMPAESIDLDSSDGHFELAWEYEIASVTIEKIGYFPRTIADPVNALDEGEGFIRVELSPGRELDVEPRNYTAVQDENRWFPDSNGPGIYTAWAHHWIEYEVDFGDAPEEGAEGGSFDILLGCTNRGIVDNEYRFHVDVYLDGEKKGTLTMLADSLNERTDRMALGELSGTHTIRLVWTNDKWIPDQLDANIRFQSLKFIEQP